jgi:hypothetical protein
MGYALLWIENLAVSLLLAATILACVGRLRRRWLRYTLWMPASLLLLLWFATLVVAAVFLRHQLVSGQWIVPTVALTVCYIIGALFLWLRGLRPAADGVGPTIAGNWPRGKLALALGIALALHAMTYWNLDLAARQQAETLRGEAGALSLSVAPPRIADSENAATLYEQARESSLPLKDDPDWTIVEKCGDPSKPGFDPNRPELRRLLKKYAAVLVLLREAASKPNCCFERNYHWLSFDTSLSDVQQLRMDAVLLDFDARAKTADGNARGAVEDINAMLAMSAHARNDPLLVCLIVSGSIEQKAIAAFQNLLTSGKLSAGDLATLRIPASPSYRTLMERASRGEEAARLTVFYGIGTGELSLQDTAKWFNVGYKADLDVEASAVGSLYRVFLFADDLAEHHRLSQEIRQITKLPYCQAKVQYQNFGTAFNRHPAGLLNRLIFPAMQAGFQYVARAGALRDALRLGVAVEKYRVGHGRLPARLEDLTPELIPVVPLDPFDGKPMRMRRTEHGLVVYSIGPDGIDNGGTPIPPIQKSGQPYPPPGDVTFEVPDRKR